MFAIIPRSLLRYSGAAALIASVLAPLPAMSQAATDASAMQYDSDVHERVLVPISVWRVPGAYGTVWSTELWFRNNSDRSVSIFPLATSDSAPPIGQTELLQIGTYPAHAPGQILFMSRHAGTDVQFDLRLFNRADLQGWGTKIPVVREHEFGDTVSLINVPTSAEFRTSLRVYGLPDDVLSGETVRVRIYSYDEGLLAEADMPLRGVPQYAAILSLADAFPEIRQVDRVRVHVEATSDVKIWAIVSIVSNSTQNVELVTPD